jgi:hypothetical protein
VDALVVDLLDPGAEQRVDLIQVGDVALGELDQELGPHGAEEALDLAPSGRLARVGVHQLDPEDGAGALQRGGDERGAVVAT